MTTMHSAIIYACLTLGLLSACAKDTDSSESNPTESDGSTPLAPNTIEDAAVSGEPDSGEADSGEAGNGRAGSGGSAGASTHVAGRRAEQSGGAGAPAEQPEPAISDAGMSLNEPDNDAGPGEPKGLCASCGGCEETIKVVSTMHTEGTVNYADPPPTSGPHNPCWGRWGVHDEPLAPERWVHNLEHGGVVFLYNCPDGCEEEVAALKAINSTRYRTIVTAYAALPTRFAVVSWGHRLLSDCLDEATYLEFYNQNFAHAPESNANPPNPGCPP
jgi:hypothetical protein